MWYTKEARRAVKTEKIVTGLHQTKLATRIVAVFMAGLRK